MLACRLLSLWLGCMLLCAGCSKANEDRDAPFVGLWTGVVVNIQDASDRHTLTINLPQYAERDSQTRIVDCEIIPTYRHVTASFEHPDLDDGGLILILHNESPQWPEARIICTSPCDNQMNITLSIANGAKYTAALRRI